MSDHRPRARRPATGRPALLLALLAALTALVAAPTVASAAPGDPPIGGAELGGATTVVHVPAGIPQPPALPAKGYLLADLTSGQVLVAHDVHRRLLTASTMKVLTALTLLPRIDPNLVYTATRAEPTSTAARWGSSPARRTRRISSSSA